MIPGSSKVGRQDAEARALVNLSEKAGYLSGLEFSAGSS